MTNTDAPLVKISAVASDDAPDCDLVRGWLRDYNWQANSQYMEALRQPQHESRRLVMLAHADDRAIGGLFAETQLKWLRILIMAVAPELRSHGVGAALLAAAETEARRRGCVYAYVDTMEYQAPRFYLKHGFEVVGRIPDWDSHGHAKLYLRKSLLLGDRIGVAGDGTQVFDQP